MRIALLACALLLAGCAQPADNPPAATTLPVVIVDDRPDTSFGDVATGPTAGPDLAATTAEAPRLVRGEWWKIRFDSQFFVGKPEMVRVVADATSDGYVFGMPHEGWFKEAIAYHAPAFGDVGLDLSYETHNQRFEPVKFPLVEGATWKTIFATTEYTATVERADATTATIRFDPKPSEPQPTDAAFAALSPFGATGIMRVEYDARQHEVVKLVSDIGQWQVVDHGYDFQGWVTVPRAIHTAIDYGQFLPATPGEPAVKRTKMVEGGYNRLTIVHGIFALGPGAYRITSTSPNGTAFVTEHVGGQSFTLKFYEASSPDGEWQLEDVVGGPGATYTMGMAYHQYDVRLPDGVIRTDHSHPVIR